MAAAKQQNALVPVTELSQYAVATLEHNEVMEILKESCGPRGITQQNLERIAIPSGGGTMWEVTSLDGEVEMVPMIEGILLHRQNQRVYWQQSFEATGGGAPPDCYSNDAVIGHGPPADQVGGHCADCPLSRFGTAEKNGKLGRGQACQERALLFILRPDSILPVTISAPPTSLKLVENYVMQLAGRAIRYHAVVTRFYLEQDKNQDGIKYSKVRPKLGKQLTREEHARILPLREMVVGRAKTIDLDDFRPEGAERTAGGPAAYDAEAEAPFDVDSAA